MPSINRPYCCREGIDLADFFNPRAADHADLRLVVSSHLEAEIEERFDLITCVHGMPYLGDKLATLFKFSAMVKTGGLLIVNLDTHDFFGPDRRTIYRELNCLLRAAGCTYEGRNKIIRMTSYTARFSFRVLGADDRMGTNYTGQNTVGSYYDLTGVNPSKSPASSEEEPPERGPYSSHAGATRFMFTYASGG